MDDFDSAVHGRNDQVVSALRLRLRDAKLLVLEAIFIGLIVLVKFIAKSITFLPNPN